MSEAPPPLSDLEAIRRRPGMYVGDPDSTGLYYMATELIANSVDQYLAGHCKTIAMELHENGALSVRDDGEGIRVDVEHGIPFAERALTMLHHTPTLDGHAYHVHSGDIGLGMFPVCALSGWLELESRREGRAYTQRFARGVAVTSLSNVGESADTGTSITFLPDPEIFRNARFDASALARRAEELSRLCPGLTITLSDRRVHRFRAENGIEGFLTETLGVSRLGSAFVCRAVEEDVRIEVAAAFTTRVFPDVESFVNLQRTRKGTHVAGLVAGLADGLQASLPADGKAPRRKALEKAVRDRLQATVAVRLADPTYGAPTRDELATPRVEPLVRRCVAKHFAAHLANDAVLREELASRLERDD